VAIVTGASSGIGAATARALVRAGVRVALAARSTARLEALAAELNGGATGAGDGLRALAITTDVSDNQAVQRMVAQVVARWGRVDVLVSNAGYGMYAPLAEASLDAMHRLMDVNYFGALNCIQAVVPHMRTQGKGVIVSVSSIVGKHINPYQGPYCATKYALIAAADSLRVELEPFGIHVITSLPGVTRTEFQANALRERVAPPSRAGLRGVGPEKVATSIVRAIRQNGPAEVYATLFDRAYVTFATTFPRLTDRVLLYLVNRKK
jgi:uncharacterized protein